jgi:hypothetical protein
MLTKASKCSDNIIKGAANLIYEDKEFLTENFAFCNNPTEVSKALTASDSWFVFGSNQPSAVFELQTLDSAAVISRIFVDPSQTSDRLTAGFLGELREMKITKVTIRARPSDAERFSSGGFDRGLTYHRFSRSPEETDMMPILPLIKATRKELPTLSRLMYDSYAKTDQSFSDVQSAERSLRAVMSGSRGRYASDASFASGALPNLVSACILILESAKEARVEQLFTHPLYRARGLATTEIGAAMNSLVAAGVKSLNIWNRDGNDVVRRLLLKMGFKKDRTIIEMTSRV